MEEQEAHNTPKQKRRKRGPGAPPGNKNALKHGFYSSSLTAAERKKLREASEIRGLGHEIAVFRVKMESALSNPNVDLRQLSVALAALTRAEAVQQKALAAEKGEDDLAESIEAVLKGVGAQMGLGEFRREEDV